MSKKSAFRTFLTACTAVLFACTLLAVPCTAPAADFQADLLYSDSDTKPRKGGTAMAQGTQARLDVRLGKAGDFTLLVDREARRMRVLSQRLKGYVETTAEGPLDSWRDILRNASSVLMPQTLGMVSLAEKSSSALGRERLEGLEAEKSRHVFTLGFLGSFRDLTVVVWENARVSPFPLKAEVVEDERTESGAIWLGSIKDAPASADFAVPAGFTRFTSILDLLLYALSAI